jgi:hypothetical protein
LGVFGDDGVVNSRNHEDEHGQLGARLSAWAALVVVLIFHVHVRERLTYEMPHAHLLTRKRPVIANGRVTKLNVRRMMPMMRKAVGTLAFRSIRPSGRSLARSETVGSMVAARASCRLKM